MATNIKDKWFRVAGHSKAVKEKLPQLWRCFVDQETDYYPMISWDVKGEANGQNVVPGSSDVEGEDPRLWFSFYGDFEIDDDQIGHFTLKNPL